MSYESMTNNELGDAHKRLQIDIGELYHSMAQSDPSFELELNAIWDELQQIAIILKARGIDKLEDI